MAAKAATDVFLQPDENRDFGLLVEGQVVYVDRYYLSCWSPVLKKIFYPEGALFKQPKGGMVMKGKKQEDFLVFLQAICPTAKALTIDELNVEVLVAYADEYDVAVLRDRCVKFMQKQLKKGKVEGNGLIDYLRLATTYNLNDLQKQLVPLVAQLPFDKITAAHAQLPLSVLAVVYESKALALQVDRRPTLPDSAFWCSGSGCRSATCSISKGASSCCNVGVGILAQAAAQVEAQCSFTCAECSKPCSLKVYSINPTFCVSSCCDNNLFVYANWVVCKKRSADDAAAGAPPKAGRFSADLLDRDK